MKDKWARMWLAGLTGAVLYLIHAVGTLQETVHLQVEALKLQTEINKYIKVR